MKGASRYTYFLSCNRLQVCLSILIAANALEKSNDTFVDLRYDPPECALTEGCLA